MLHHGGCLCGAVRYAATAEPVRVTICHCTFCQRFTGTAYLVEPIFRCDDVAFFGDTPKTYNHRSDESGKRVALDFCGQCGATLRLRFERFPEVVGICAGTFDDPNWFARGAATCRHIFTRSAQKGVVLPSGIPIYDAHVTSAEGVRNEPRVYAEPVEIL